MTSRAWSTQGAVPMPESRCGAREGVVRRDALPLHDARPGPGRWPARVSSAAWKRSDPRSPATSTLAPVRTAEASAANIEASSSSCSAKTARPARVDVESPDRRLQAYSGEERIDLMPSERAFGVKAGHRSSSVRDRVWNRRPSTEASIHGPLTGGVLVGVHVQRWSGRWPPPWPGVRDVGGDAHPVGCAQRWPGSAQPPFEGCRRPHRRRTRRPDRSVGRRGRREAR